MHASPNRRDSTNFQPPRRAAFKPGHNRAVSENRGSPAVKLSMGKLSMGKLSGGKPSGGKPSGGKVSAVKVSADKQ